MSKNRTRTILHPGIAASILLAMVLGHSAPLIAQETKAGENESSEAAEAGAVAEDDTAAKPKGSPGMSIPLDGSSSEAFEASMEVIQAQTTAAEFTTLENALDYLQVYDLSARGDRELLYKNLDGKTPNEVLEMVMWRQKGKPRPTTKSDT